MRATRDTAPDWRRIDLLEKRQATAEEIRALASPVRLRILRLCLDQAMTNKQLAGVLGLNPGTTLHHVRLLLENDFLQVEEVRPGPRGSTEKLLRVTGKSWTVGVGDEPGAEGVSYAVLDAVRDELREAGPGARIADYRLGVRLSAEDRAELEARLTALAQEYSRRDEPGGEPVALYMLLHRRPRG